MSVNEIHVTVELDEEMEQAIDFINEAEIESATAQAQKGVPLSKKIGAGIDQGGEIAGLAGRGMSGGPMAARAMLLPMIPHLVPLMIAAGVAQQLFVWARGPGGPLDKRYERDLTREVNSSMSRQLQRDTEIGSRQVIIAISSNFKNLGGAGSNNNLKQIRESGTRQAATGLLVVDAAVGLERQ